MKYQKIDIQGSITSNSIKYKTLSWSALQDYSAIVLSFGSPPVLIGVIVFQEIRDGNFGLFYILLFLGTIGLFLYTLYSIRHWDDLLRISFSDKKSNHLAISSLAASFNYKLLHHSTSYSVLDVTKQYSDGWSREKEVLIIYDQNDILINASSFGAFKSPFHFKSNRKIEKEIIDRIKTVIKNKTHANNG